MIRREDVYRIGRIGKPHGVNGEVSFMFDDDVFDRTDAEYLVLDIDGILVPFFMDEYRFHGNATALVTFCGIDTQDKARTITGCDVYFPREVGDDDDTLTWAKIVGYTVVNAADLSEMGKITAVDDNTVNTLFVIDTPDGEILVPAAMPLIVAVDENERRITMHIPEGILELNKI